MFVLGAMWGHVSRDSACSRDSSTLKRWTEMFKICFKDLRPKINLLANLLKSSFCFNASKWDTVLVLLAQILKRGCGVNDRDGLTDMSLLHYCCKAGAQGIGQYSHIKELDCKSYSLLLVLRCVFLLFSYHFTSFGISLYFATLPPYFSVA